MSLAAVDPDGRAAERLRLASDDLKFTSLVNDILHLERRMKLSMNQLTNQEVSTNIDSILTRVKEIFLEGVFIYVASDKARWHSGARDVGLKRFGLSPQLGLQSRCPQRSSMRFKDTCRNLLMHTRSGVYNEHEAMNWMLRVT